jgi:hypothetical protein
VVVDVSDAGAGPDDPFAGLLPRADGEPGGLGLWLAHQLCSHVTMRRTGGRFTVALTAGDPHGWEQPWTGTPAAAPVSPAVGWPPDTAMSPAGSGPPGPGLPDTASELA